MRLLLKIVALALLILLFAGSPGKVHFRSFGEIWNLGHLLVFGLWTWLFLSSPITAGWGWRRQASTVLAAGLAAGLLTEYLQSLVGRSPDMADVGRDVLGAAFALVFFSPARRHLPRGVLRWMQGGVVAGVAVAMIPLGACALDDLRARRDFPVLSDFESPLETGRWGGGARMERRSEHSSHGRFSMRIDFATTRYSGVFLRYFPTDWSGYAALRFSVFNPSDSPLKLSCRIDDRHHKDHGRAYSDRFNAVFTLKPGWNEISVDLAEAARAPKGRGMDMAGIESFGLFTVELPRPRTIYLDHVRLSK